MPQTKLVSFGLRANARRAHGGRSKCRLRTAACVGRDAHRDAAPAQFSEVVLERRSFVTDGLKRSLRGDELLLQLRNAAPADGRDALVSRCRGGSRRAWRRRVEQARQFGVHIVSLQYGVQS